MGEDPTMHARGHVPTHGPGPPSDPLLLGPSNPETVENQQMVSSAPPGVDGRPQVLSDGTASAMAQHEHQGGVPAINFPTGRRTPPNMGSNMMAGLLWACALADASRSANPNVQSESL